MHYRADVDGLRGIAVSMVLLFHTGIDAFKGGFIGVDIFFVISGYIITKWIQSSLGNSAYSLKMFYEKRVRRIYPALFVVMAANIPIVYYVFPENYFVKFLKSLIAICTLNSNHYFWYIGNYFEQDEISQVLLHTWTLGIEEQFYFILPLLMMYTGSHFKSVAAVLAVLSLVASEVAVDYLDPQLAFFILPFRMWEFLAGSLTVFVEEHLVVANAFHVLVAKVVALMLLGVSALSFSPISNHPGVITVVPTACIAVLIYLGDITDDIISKLLSNRISTFIGRISYSLYLWHQPVFTIARVLGLFDRNDQLVIIWIIVFVASFMIAVVSWAVIEQPFRNKKKTSTRFLVTFWIFTSAAIVVFAATFGSIIDRQCSHCNDSDLQPSSNSTMSPTADFKTCNRKAGLLEIKKLPAFQIPDHPSCSIKSPKGKCILGSPKFDPAVALLGDSHASQLENGIVKSLLTFNHSFSILDLTTSGSPFLYNFTCKTGKSTVTGANAELAERILSPRISTIVISNRWLKYVHDVRFDNFEGAKDTFTLLTWCKRNAKVSALWNANDVMQGYDEAIKEILRLNKTVILVYPIPEAGWHVPAVTKRRFLLGNRTLLTTSYAAYQQFAGELVQQFDKLTHKNLVKVKTERLFCNLKELGTAYEGRCVTHDCSHLFYRDPHHLSVEGGNVVAARIVEIIARVLGINA